ncbi:hypothetical protein [Pectinatus frisingensis]|uniref:hypothetical protein n=1 Tax=Pectinatus frisingensis TaxID=865 RepID=UPI0018C76620|nr:hypothetical protein [Pectinatus frisingensis]
MSKLGGSSFVAGAAGAGINEVIIKELGEIRDPAVMQWASAAVGAAAAKVTGGSAAAGAGAAASETKNNWLSHGMAKLYVDLRKLIKNDKTLTDDEKNKKLQILQENWQEIDNKLGTGADHDAFTQYGVAYYIDPEGRIVGFMDDAKTHVMTIIMSKNDDTVPGIGLTQADSDSFNSNIKSFDYGEPIRNNIIEEGITDMATLPYAMYGNMVEKNGKFVLGKVFGSVGTPIQLFYDAFADSKTYSGNDFKKAKAADLIGAALSTGSDLLISGSGGISFTFSTAANVVISTGVDKYKNDKLKTDTQKKAENGE